VNYVALFALDHSRLSVAKGWNLATCGDDGETDDGETDDGETDGGDAEASRPVDGGQGGGYRNTDRNISSRNRSEILGVWPYWMSRDLGTPNDIDLDSMALLTAPNMSGKSTLMRSAAAAALLTVCGMFSPTSEGSHVRRYNTIFFRGASADVPAEGKSAFGKECEDVTEMFASCDSDSLVFIDELGRGTSPADGTALAGAVLESMCEKQFSGFFATHLHGVLDLEMSGAAKARMKAKRMGIAESGTDEVEWTFRMEDGVSADSLALVTAKKFGMPQAIIDRASHFAKELGGGGGGGGGGGSYGSYGRYGGSGIGGTLKTHRAKSVVDMLERVCVTGVGKGRRVVKEPTANNNANNNNSGDDATAGGAVMIGPGSTAPPFLEGKSCVYVLQIPPSSSSSSPANVGESGQAGKMVYVGETDSMSRRLAEHRLRTDLDLDWNNCEAACVPVGRGKSEARSLETVLLSKLLEEGHDLVTIKDASNVNFARFD